MNEDICKDMEILFYIECYNTKTERKRRDVSNSTPFNITQFCEEENIKQKNDEGKFSLTNSDQK